MRPTEILDITSLYVSALFDGEGCDEIINALHFEADDGSDFKYPWILERLEFFKKQFGDLDMNDLGFNAVDSVLELVFSQINNLELEGKVLFYVDKDKNNGFVLYDRVVKNYYGELTHDLTSWFMLQYAKPLGLSKNEIKQWDRENLTQKEHFIRLFSSVSSFDHDCYDFAKAYVMEEGDGIASAIFQRIPLVLWQMVGAERSLYSQRVGAKGYRIVSFEEELTYSKLTEGDVVYLLIFMSSGRRVSFDLNGRRFSLSNPENKPGSEFVLSSEKNEIARNSAFDMILCETELYDQLTLFEAMPKITNIKIEGEKHEK